MRKETERQYYLAVDLGASGGRHILAWLEDGRLKLEEIYRFANGPVRKNRQMCWDLERLFKEVINGMKLCREAGKIPCSVGVDTWGLDYVFLDHAGRMAGNAVNHRDPRTKGIYAAIFERIPERKLYQKTGIQMAEFNTLCQLMAVKRDQPELLNQAQTMMMIPDYFHYRLTGTICQEYTNASVTQLLNPAACDWDRELIRTLGLPQRLFLPVTCPGHELGMMKREIAEAVGYNCRVVLPPTHDTASAFLALTPETEGRTAAVSSGTWSLVGTETNEPLIMEEGGSRNFTNEGGYGHRNLLLKNSMGLWMIQNLRRENALQLSFGEISNAARLAEIDSLVDCGGEEFLAPLSMTEAVRSACRKTGQQIPEGIGELSRVVYRSLALSYKTILKEMEHLTGQPFTSFHILGGGSKADFLNCMTAEFTGLLVYAGPAEATAIGNLMAQMIAAGVFKDSAEARAKVRNSFKIRKYEPQGGREAT